MEFLEITPEEKIQICKQYNVDDARIKEDIELIKIWKIKQLHLPNNLTDDFIENILLRNKFRVEQTKQKLDNYFSLRGNNRELIRNFETIIPSKESTIFLPLPKLTPQLERIVILKLINFDVDLHDTTKLIKLNLAVTELLIQYDSSIGVKYLIDFSGFTLKHLTKWNPVLIAKHVTLIEKAYSCRILGIELIHFPSFANRVLALLKIILRPKIYERVKVHHDLESLYKVVPKHCLPSEYGGSLNNIPDLLRKWDEIMSSHKDFFLKNYENVSLEHLRSPESTQSEAFGTEGTFKKLTID